MIAKISKHMTIAASPEAVFAAVTAWDCQADWMVGTTVTAGKRAGHANGGTIVAFTGLGPLGFRDTMTITDWDPPRSCGVQHTGKIVRGSGLFLVRPAANGQAVFTWEETLNIPLGFVGKAGWILGKPLFGYGMQVSLRRLANSLQKTPTL